MEASKRFSEITWEPQPFRAIHWMAVQNSCILIPAPSGVNAHSKYMVPAVELAVYLGSADAQKLHYELRSVIPCSTELQDDPVISSDPVFLAQNDTFDNTSKLQPFVSRMANCWTPMENMGKSIRNGTVTHENAAEQTKSMNDAMNSNGIE